MIMVKYIYYLIFVFSSISLIKFIPSLSSLCYKMYNKYFIKTEFRTRSSLRFSWISLLRIFCGTNVRQTNDSHNHRTQNHNRITEIANLFDQAAF